MQAVAERLFELVSNQSSDERQMSHLNEDALIQSNSHLFYRKTLYPVVRY